MRFRGGGRLPPALARTARIIGINLAVLLALLIPIELVFGEWFSSENAITMLNVGPNTLTIKPSFLYPPGTTITYRRNAYGFRGPAQDPSHTDVLAIGGSTTNERFVDEKDTWVVRLEALMRQRNCPLSIANTGIDGYSTVAHIASFDTWFNHVPGLKPRFVLAYIGINDAGIEPGVVFQADSMRYAGWSRRLAHYLAANSAIHRLYAQLHGWWRAREAGLLHGEASMHGPVVWVAAPPGEPSPKKIAAQVRGYRNRLEELNRRIRAFGAQPIYITQVRIDGREVDGAWQEFDQDGAKYTATTEAIDRETLAFCRDSGEVCVDLAGKLAIPHDEFYDSMHLTPAGSALVAHFLADELAPTLCRPAAN
jgi:lysophospholipase L1-like esterase